MRELARSPDSAASGTKAAIAPRVSSDFVRNVLERTRLSAGVFAWSYTFPRPSPQVSFLSLGLEVGVVLEGERWRSSELRGTLRYRRGMVSVSNPGDFSSTRYTPDERGAGREIGFAVPLDHCSAGAPEGHLFSFPTPVVVDRSLSELCAALASDFPRAGGIPLPEVEGEIVAFLRRHADLVRLDPLERARLELHRHFDKPLYMRHFAEVAGLHPATLARKFAARYGMTPTRYRTLLRLSEAAILLATRPSITVRESAALVGFEDVPYFHRAFAAQFGRPPLELARGFSQLAG